MLMAGISTGQNLSTDLFDSFRADLPNDPVFRNVCAVCLVLSALGFVFNTALFITFTVNRNEDYSRLTASAYCIVLTTVVNFCTLVFLVPPFLYNIWTGRSLFEGHDFACRAHAIFSSWAKCQVSVLAFLLALLRLSSWFGWIKPNKEKRLVVAAVLLPLALSGFDSTGRFNQFYEYDTRAHHCVIRASFVYSELFASTVFAFVAYEVLILLNCVAIAIRRNFSYGFRAEALLLLSGCALSPLFFLQNELIPSKSKENFVSVVQMALTYGFILHTPLAFGGSYFLVECKLVKRVLKRPTRNAAVLRKGLRKKTVREELMNADMSWWINFYASEPYADVDRRI